MPTPQLSCACTSPTFNPRGSGVNLALTLMLQHLADKAQGPRKGHPQVYIISNKSVTTGVRVGCR